MDRGRVCARDRSDLRPRRSDRADKAAQRWVGSGRSIRSHCCVAVRGAGVAELIVLVDGTEVGVRLESDTGRHSVTVESAPSRVELRAARTSGSRAPRKVMARSPRDRSGRGHRVHCLAGPGAPGAHAGGVAEWLGKGLQNPVHRFNSGPRLEPETRRSVRCRPRALSSGVERFLDAEEVRGSNPLAPTNEGPGHRAFSC